MIGNIVVLRKFDLLLYRIYDSDRERWKKLGSPTGYFWHPKEKLPFFRSTFSRDAFFFDFLSAGLKDPNPPSGQPEAPR
jgi:hypothetical protein